MEGLGETRRELLLFGGGALKRGDLLWGFRFLLHRGRKGSKAGQELGGKGFRCAAMGRVHIL